MRRAVVVVVVIVMMMTVAMVTMAMVVRMIMVVMVDALAWSATLRAFAEHERLDGDRYGVGGHPDAAEIDVVEVAQHHSVNRQDLAFNQQLLAQDRAERLGNIAIEHDVDRL